MSVEIEVSWEFLFETKYETKVPELSIQLSNYLAYFHGDRSRLSLYFKDTEICSEELLDYEEITDLGIFSSFEFPKTIPKLLVKMGQGARCLYRPSKHISIY